jgi:tRNA (cytidine/uridine-2'-O-)-methyltransferase
MITLVLYKPQIPPNTGNIMRLCSNTGFQLHLIKPLGFNLDDKSLKRAKLDYFSNTEPIVFKDLDTYVKNTNIQNLIIITKFGKKKYTEAKFSNNSVIIFGSETEGLPQNFIKKYENITFRIPMKNNSRSLNLSNAAAIISYEAWKSLNFSGEGY